MLAKKYGPGSVASYFGGRRKKTGRILLNAFKTRIQSYGSLSVSHALVVTALRDRGEHRYLLHNSYDLEIRLQSEDRAHRIGQNDTVTYVDLVSPGTIDEKILSALRDKINIAGDVLGESAKDWLI